MKFTLSWLKDHLDTKASLDAILQGLYGIGLEVEAVEDKTGPLAPFRVAHVVEAVKHPNADKLRLCKVDTGEGVIQVVCGAPNARTGMKGVLALPGAFIPGTGITLEKGMIRGEASEGMLCSERELLISQEHDGIIEVAGNIAIGTPAATALGLDDPMIYIKVTANRPDALGVYGIARDLAAKGLGTLKPLAANPVPGSYDSPIAVTLDFPGNDMKPCPLFVGRHFRKVKNGPSPAWLQRRLKAIGLRPISALVDITNYITFTYGRPLHVFDAAKIRGPIGARFAREGETILALDGKTYPLSSGMTVIADAQGPEAIGGIIGGEVTGCTEDTTEVFLEAAVFDPTRTAATGRRLGIQSDARYRFERGIDPAFTATGAEIATRMILDLCGGETSRPVAAGAVPPSSRNCVLRRNRVRALGGVDIPWADQLGILGDLGFAVTETAEGASCAVPSWRPDVQGEADLVEEICRIYGLDNIPFAAMERSHAVAAPVLTPLQRRMIAARRTLARRGCNEAVTWAFLPASHAELFGGGQPALKLANPISSELTDMRPSLLPNLVAAAARNMDRGFGDLAVCEVGHAYAGDRPEDETLRAAAVRTGDAVPRNWHGGHRLADIFDAKADAIAVLEAAGLSASGFQIVAGAPSWFHPGRSGTIRMGPKNILAWFGELHPRVLAAMDVKGPAVGFEAVLSAIPVPRAKSSTRPPLDASDLMPVRRDFAFVADATVEADQIVKAARGAEKALIAEVSVFDLFPLEDGRVSLAIEVVLQPRDRTLTDAEIDKVSEKIVAAVGKATGAMLRA